jgi:hypothetical protein
MPIKIVHRNDQEKTLDFEARISQLIDAEDWSIVCVIEENEEGYRTQPVFILKQKIQENITSVLSVPLEQVDSMLAKGYKVKELYAKSCTLIKTEVKA